MVDNFIIDVTIWLVPGTYSRLQYLSWRQHLGKTRRRGTSPLICGVALPLCSSHVCKPSFLYQAVYPLFLFNGAFTQNRTLMEQQITSLLTVILRLQIKCETCHQRKLSANQFLLDRRMRRVIIRHVLIILPDLLKI